MEKRRIEKERPILFSAPMVRSILDGSKTQTRRIIKAPKEKGNSRPYIFEIDRVEKNDRYNSPFPGIDVDWILCAPRESGRQQGINCPYGSRGTYLWVRETWGLFSTEPEDGPEHAIIFYRASDGWKHELRYQKWKPSIHMPRWASRITIEVESVRVERLIDISEKDAMAEGVQRIEYGPNEIGGIQVHPHTSSYRDAFKELWEVINGPSSWEVNPWVWVLTFRRI